MARILWEGASVRRFTVASIAVLVVVIAVVAIASVLLAETVTTAQKINDKAQNIAHTGRGINAATDSVIQLHRTNDLALSILKSARPLQGQLGGIVGVAQGINGEAGSILGSAGTINSTAGTINSTAKTINSDAQSINGSATSVSGSAGSINTSAGRINSSAGSILGSALSINGSATGIDGEAGSIVTIARRINTDVNLINDNLDVTIGVARTIKGDTGNILSQALTARGNAACIDREVVGAQGNDGQCQGLTAAVDSPTGSQLKRLSKLKQLALQHAGAAFAAPAQSSRTGQSGPIRAPGVPGGYLSPQPVTTPPPLAQAPPPPTGPVNVLQQILNHLFG